MTSDPCLVDWCDRPVGDGYVCQRCADRLSVALGDVPALWEELDVVLTKQARYAAAEFRRGERALPFNPEASEIGWVLRNTLTTWCRVVAEERGRDLPDDNPAAISGWLLGHVVWLRHHRAGHEAVEEIVSIVDKIRKAIDRPAPRVYAGPCKECNGDMYGQPGAASVDCRPCGLSYDVAEMVEWMRNEAWSRLVTAREATVLFGRMGLTVPRKTIEKWNLRSRLLSHGEDRSGTRLYLFSEVWALVNGTDGRVAS